MVGRAAFDDGRCLTSPKQLSAWNPQERFVSVAPEGGPAQRVETPSAPSTAPQNVKPADGSLLFPIAGGTLWLTGLPGAGKTTLALAAERVLLRRGHAVCVLDGDVLRSGLSSDLGLSPADRREQARRAAHVAALVSGAGVVALVALVSPYAEDRQRARDIHKERGLPFFEVWVNTPLAVCEQRDPKGLYARARAGELGDLTGVDAPYQAPESPELRVAGYGEDSEEVAARIVELLIPPAGWAVRDDQLGAPAR